MAETPRVWGVQVSEAMAAPWERHRRVLFETYREISEWLVDQLRPQPGETVLELGAGPGETGFLAAARVGAGGRLISTDLGQGMVDAARRGAEERGLANVECRVMDAHRLDLEDSSVDGVLSRFGLMLMEDPAQVLREARRVLRPGGRVAYAVWGDPEQNPGLTLPRAAVEGSGIQLPPPAPLLVGPFSLADPERNRRLVGDAGLEEMAVQQLVSGTHFTSVDAYWSVQSEVAGQLAMILASLDADRVQAIRATLTALMEPFAITDGYLLPSQVVLVAASKPR